VHLGDQAGHFQTRRLDAADVRLDIAVEGIETALAAGTPEQAVEREAGAGGDAVGGTGGARRQIAEQRDLGIEQEGQLVVVPQRVEFGEIGDIEAALLQAGIVEDRSEPDEDRIDVPVRVIEGTKSRCCPG
jgi:hypothetical protein